MCNQDKTEQARSQRAKLGGDDQGLQCGFALFLIEKLVKTKGLEVLLLAFLAALKENMACFRLSVAALTKPALCAGYHVK